MPRRERRPLDDHPGAPRGTGVELMGRDVYRRTERTGARAIGSLAMGPAAISAMAVGAVAIGALAIGALAIGRLAMGRLRVRRLAIDELEVRRLRITEGLELPASVGNREDA